jgi:HD domain
MLSAVDQLVAIATWIRHHHERWDGHGFPDRLAGPAIPMPSRIIALADGYLDAVGREGGMATRWRSAQRAAGAYDPDLLEVLAAELEKRDVPPAQQFQVQLALSGLQPGMKLAEPIATSAGATLVKADEVVTPELLQRLHALGAAGALASDTTMVWGKAATG